MGNQLAIFSRMMTVVVVTVALTPVATVIKVGNSGCFEEGMGALEGVGGLSLSLRKLCAVEKE